jgi:hypothetical protein
LTQSDALVRTRMAKTRPFRDAGPRAHSGTFAMSMSQHHVSKPPSEWRHLFSTAGLRPVEPRMTKLEASRPRTGEAIAVPRMPALGPPSDNYYPAPGNAPAATKNQTKGYALVLPFVNTRLSFPQAPRPAESIDRPAGDRLSGRPPATTSNHSTTSGPRARVKAITVLGYVISQGHVCALLYP